MANNTINRKIRPYDQGSAPASGTTEYAGAAKFTNKKVPPKNDKDNEAGQGSEWKGNITREGKEQQIVIEKLMISDSGQIKGQGTDNQNDFLIEGTCLLEPGKEPNTTFT